MRLTDSTENKQCTAEMTTDFYSGNASSSRKPIASHAISAHEHCVRVLEHSYYALLTRRLPRPVLAPWRDR